MEERFVELSLHKNYTSHNPHKLLNMAQIYNPAIIHLSTLLYLYNWPIIFCNN